METKHTQPKATPTLADVQRYLFSTRDDIDSVLTWDTDLAPGYRNHLTNAANKLELALVALADVQRSL